MKIKGIALVLGSLLIVFLPFLLGGCGEASTPSTPTHYPKSSTYANVATYHGGVGTYQILGTNIEVQVSTSTDCPYEIHVDDNFPTKHLLPNIIVTHGGVTKTGRSFSSGDFNTFDGRGNWIVSAETLSAISQSLGMNDSTITCTADVSFQVILPYGGTVNQLS